MGQIVEQDVIKFINNQNGVCIYFDCPLNTDSHFQFSNETISLAEKLCLPRYLFFPIDNQHDFMTEIIFKTFKLFRAPSIIHSLQLITNLPNRSMLLIDFEILPKDILVNILRKMGMILAILRRKNILLCLYTGEKVNAIQQISTLQYHPNTDKYEIL